MTDIVVGETPQDVADAAADLIFEWQAAAINERGVFRVALSGGSTPSLLYKTLSSAEWKDDLSWEHWEVFFSDERAVPPDHAESNYRHAYELLLRHVPVSDVWRMPGESSDLKRAADEYARTLKARFGPGMPRFDTILLGLGTDGHTASLFPNHSALRSSAWIEAVQVVHAIPNRLTMTLPLINDARQVLFLVTGSTKAETVREVLVHRNPDLPATLVQPLDGRCWWLLDQEAAALME